MKRNFKVIVMTLAILATMTGCGSNVQTDNSEKTTTQVSVTTKTEVAPTDSSETDTSDTDFTDSKLDSESKTDTTDDSKSDSSSDESKSEKAATTTKTSESKNESEKAVTTTKQSSTTTSAVATQPVATKATAKPIVTTKATQKPTVTAKQTTKATTKATPKVTSKQKADPTANMSPYYKALYRIGSGKGTASDYETVRTEIINYGKKLYPKYKLNPNLHLYRLPNGKLTDDYQTGVTFNEITCREACELPTSSLEDINAFDNDVRCLVVENLSWYGGYDPNEFNITWYVQFSKQQIGTCVIVLAKAE